MKMLKILLPMGLLMLGSVGIVQAAETKTDAVNRLDSAAKALQQIASAPDKGIPQEVLEGAKCVAVVPSLLKGGFIFGAKHGRGVATCRLPDGKWSAPAFFTITGGSWGAQIGAENVQLVMMIMNNDGMQNLLKDKFKIGGAASGAAGPVGRHASAGTDWKANTEILTYSRTQGLFAGINLTGSWVERDASSTKALYGKNLTTTQILTGKVSTPASAQHFVSTVKDEMAKAKATS